MRSTFERHVEKYVNARNTTEGLLRELGTLLNMFKGLGGEDIPSKIKTKVRDITDSKLMLRFGWTLSGSDSVYKLFCTH